MGTLYTIATPIGNLEDITLRAIRLLQEVSLILCEDTRVTKRLLNHYQITTPTRPYHQHSSQQTEAWVMSQLQAGQNIALVSDAGTPTISDPGARLVSAVIAAGGTVTPIPGPSALITALQAAGVDTSQFTFYGFLPHKKGRQTLLQAIAAADHTIVFYESIHRLEKAITALADSKKYIVVARELTKTFEEFIRGDATSVATIIRQHPTLKGECVVIVSPARSETLAGDTAKPHSRARR
ncbi:MAG: 16S rRNA (cytidine(1402)-2'-O)-methyltransferase [Candidatus Kerfeldbacteria bacterium]|nr:16S rRNA (cytidine(1402)-2'-O)-methyltransferase [Candidatus Kerfeldbacteria bacterium]